MLKQRIYGLAVLIIGALIGFFLYQGDFQKKGPFADNPFVLGLDLSGGTHLVFQADTKETPEKEIDDAMQSLRDTIERRVNVFGVSEPLVQVEKSTANNQTLHKLIVELPGVTDIAAAVESIGRTPVLEFKLLKEDSVTTATSTPEFLVTGLTGKYLKRADLQFDPNTGAPSVGLTFNDEGRQLFAKITRENTGKVLAIFLDGTPLSLPVIREEIKEGQAIINGQFTPEEAKTLVRDLNYGALPLPVALVGSQTIGPSLGENALKASVNAGLWSFIAIGIFLIFWYRLPGFLATLALAIYVFINLIIFKFVPITLTSAGLAGFILSMGMAVDANILIFERMREEIARGLSLGDAIKEGFARAWLSIRDSNLSSIITAVILYYLAGSPLIKGFALVFGLGVITSMLTSITISRTLLRAVAPKNDFVKSFTRFIFSHGLKK